jgi:hypothetical protein
MKTTTLIAAQVRSMAALDRGVSSWKGKLAGTAGTK